MSAFILVIIILVISFYTYSNNKPLHLVFLIFVAFLLEEFYPTDAINVKNVFKLGDIIILWLIFVSIRLKSTSLKVIKLPLFIYFIYFIWISLILYSLVISLVNQNTFLMIKMYRKFLWLFLPYVVIKLIQTKYDFIKFINYLITLTLIMSVLYSLQTIFPKMPFLPNASVAPSGLGGRVYGYSLFLNPITGPLSLFLFFTLKISKYWKFFLGISLAFLLTLGRSATTGYIVGIIVSFLLINYHFSFLNKKILSRFLFLIFFILLIFFTTNVSDVYYNRFIEQTTSAMEEEEISFSGRVVPFEKRLYWLKEQGDMFDYFGAGRLYPSETIIFDYDWAEKNPYQASIFLAGEGGYFHGRLVYGIVGLGLWVFSYLLLLIYLFSRNISSRNNIDFNASSISIIIYMLIAAISGIDLDEPLYMSMIVIYVSINFNLTNEIKKNNSPAHEEILIA